MKGVIFDIRRFCIHDGPGIRTTVFLKGCPLQCRWCHNPESQKHSVEVIIKKNVLNSHEIVVNEKIGRFMDAHEVIKEVLKDRVFFDQSDGGVTFSGGEPLAQADFLKSLLFLAKEHGIHTTMDTCGYAKVSDLKKIIPYTDLFLYDLKHYDEKLHIEYTKRSNKTILRNLRLLTLSKKKIIIRIPVIPGFNDSLDTLSKIASTIKLAGDGIREVNLLPYHEMAKSKYARLKRNFANFKKQKTEKQDITDFINLFETEGFKTKIGG